MQIYSILSYTHTSSPILGQWVQHRAFALADFFVHNKSILWPQQHRMIWHIFYIALPFVRIIFLASVANTPEFSVVLPLVLCFV